MKLHVFPDPHAAAREAAAHIAARARQAIEARQRFSLALSGGKSPQAMFGALAAADLAWSRVHLFQVDERLVPRDSPERNFATIRERLLARVTIPRNQIHPMPVDSDDPEAAALQYVDTLRSALGPDGMLDVAHLGLGADGHTASLLPGDPAAESTADVIVSQRYQGHRRMSLSPAVLSAARERLWLVTGADKRNALAALLDGDTTLPAGRLRRDGSVVFADRAAAR